RILRRRSTARPPAHHQSLIDLALRLRIEPDRLLGQRSRSTASVLRARSIEARRVRQASPPTAGKAARDGRVRSATPALVVRDPTPRGAGLPRPAGRDPFGRDGAGSLWAHPHPKTPTFALVPPDHVPTDWIE